MLLNDEGTSWELSDTKTRVFYWLNVSVDADQANALIISNTVYSLNPAVSEDKSLYVAPQSKAYRNSVRCIRVTSATEREKAFWEWFSEMFRNRN